MNVIGMLDAIAQYILKEMKKNVLSTLNNGVVLNA